MTIAKLISRAGKFTSMLFYMQMRNWFLIFLVLTMAYLVHQRTASAKRYALRTPSTFASIIR